MKDGIVCESSSRPCGLGNGKQRHKGMRVRISGRGDWGRVVGLVAWGCHQPGAGTGRSASVLVLLFWQCKLGRTSTSREMGSSLYGTSIHPCNRCIWMSVRGLCGRDSYGILGKALATDVERHPPPAIRQSRRSCVDELYLEY